MSKEYHCAQYAKEILQMPITMAKRTLNYILKIDGEKELNEIVSQFSKVLGGIK